MSSFYSNRYSYMYILNVCLINYGALIVLLGWAPLFVKVLFTRGGLTALRDLYHRCENSRSMGFYNAKHVDNRVQILT